MAILGTGIIKKMRKTDDIDYIKQEYGSLFENFPVACAACDFDGLMIETNKKFIELVQYRSEELENESIFKFLQFEQSDITSTYINTLMKGENVNVKSKLTAKTKEMKHTETTFIPIIKNQSLIGMYVALLDNSEKNELEEEHSQLKENINYGQQLASIGSWTHDIIKDEIFLSQEVYRILGCSPEEFDGNLQDFYSYVHPDDLNEVKEAIQGTFKGREYDIEYRIITPSGLERYVHEKTKALKDEQGNSIKMIGIMQDITEHKLIENSLKVLGDNLTQAQRVAGVGSWKYDVVNNEIFWSEEVYRIHGIDPADFKRDYESYMKLIYPEDQMKMQNAVELCLKGKPYEIEHRILFADGTIKYAIGKGEPVFDETSQVVGLIGTVQDITEKKLLEEKLKKNYENLAKAQSLAHIGSWEADVVRGKNYWSEETYRIYGITPEQYDGTYESFLNFVHPDDRKLFYDFEGSSMKEHFVDMEFRVIRPDGSVRNVYQIMENIYDNDGNLIYIYGTLQDITEKKQLHEQLENTQETINTVQKRFDILVQDSNDIFQTIAPDGTIQYVSQSIEKFYNFNSAEIIGQNIYGFFDGDEKKKLYEIVNLALNSNNKSIKGDIVIKTKLGKEVYFELTVSNLLSEPSIQGIALNWSDITRRVEIERNMAHIATHDELTQLPNRTYFNKKISMQCEDAKEKRYSFALIMLELGGVKYINSILGYELLDKLIIQVVERLNNYIGDKQFLCRYSGDQFAIIVTGIKTMEGYRNFVQNLIGLFSHALKVGVFELNVTVNVGISICPNDGQDSETLKKHANIALFRSKEIGKNKYRFHSPEMDIQSYKQFVLRNDLRKSIEKEQVRVYYQPEVNLLTSEILAAEALIRWEHPTWGIVTPNEFIPIAEETGFIINLGNWLLREVCCNYKQWLQEGMPNIKVSINYSSIQFLESNLVENIKKTIDEFELDPHFLIIEIVESVLINDLEQVTAHIKELQALGIQVALDDFGTGYSSLSYLKNFNIDMLKIDQSFIKNIPVNETSTIITRYVIQLAQELRIKIIAEGIETWEQLSFLRKLNCYTGQGYLYSKPVAQENFKKILASKKCRPVRVNDTEEEFEQRRKFFRIKFPELLEADMTILEIGGKRTQLGNTKTLVKNMGAGGICFVSNIRFPIKRDIILQFTTQLLGQEIKVQGCPVWSKERREDLYEYGLQFNIDENDRSILTGLLNQFQIKLRNNPRFNEGQFVSKSEFQYFNNKVGSHK